ncbi:MULTISPECIES: hypothetical protein [Cryobacterium]|nr:MULTISPECIES: hypothetical protein [Cryobacterium]
MTVAGKLPARSPSARRLGGVLVGSSIIGFVILVGYVVERRGILGVAAVLTLNRTAFSVTAPALLLPVLSAADVAVVFSTFLPTTLCSDVVGGTLCPSAERRYSVGMKEDTGTHGHGLGARYVHFIEWMNGKLVRGMGPANLGPYNDVATRIGAAVCPVCGRPMAEHSIDHTTPNAILHCPAGHKPAPPEEPVNEFGMSKPPG